MVAMTLVVWSVVTAAALQTFPGAEGVGGPPPPPEPRYNRTLRAWRGTTPNIDGVLEPGEWTDGFEISTPFGGSPRVMQWASEFNQVVLEADLSLTGWIKHDDKALYLGFNISDDVLHGIESPRFDPPANPQVDALNQSGWPWFVAAPPTMSCARYAAALPCAKTV